MESPIDNGEPMLNALLTLLACALGHVGRDVEEANELLIEIGRRVQGNRSDEHKITTTQWMEISEAVVAEMRKITGA